MSFQTQCMLWKFKNKVAPFGVKKTKSDVLDLWHRKGEYLSHKIMNIWKGNFMQLSNKIRSIGSPYKRTQCSQIKCCMCEWIHTLIALYRQNKSSVNKFKCLSRANYPVKDKTNAAWIFTVNLYWNIWSIIDDWLISIILRPGKDVSGVRQINIKIGSARFVWKK